MTDHRPAQGPNKPSRRQLAYLRALADRTGQTFTWPQTSRQASREIRRLLDQPATPAADRRRERRQIADDMATRRGDDAQVRHGRDTSGYGSSATWKRGAEQ